MNDAPPQGGPPPVLSLDTDPVRFQRRLTIITYSLIAGVLVIYLLREFAVVLRPLCVAVLLGYLILPFHDWLVDRGIRSRLAYAVMLLLFVAVLVGLAQMVYASIDSLLEQRDEYEAKLNGLLAQVQHLLPEAVTRGRPWRVNELLRVDSFDQVKDPLQKAAGSFVGFVTGTVIVFVYLIFLMAEKESFPRRVERALGPAQSRQVMEVMSKINGAITQYLVGMTLMCLLTAAATAVVLTIFQVPFLIVWVILTFLLNYIPYLGSAVSLVPPILLGLVQYADQLWLAVLLAAALIAVNQVIGQVIQPRFLGRRLGVSPLLIILSLAFWGVVWGIVGMILSVPLLVSFKIVLDHIAETKPVATLMANE